MEKLSAIIADRLGYKGIPMQCKPYKMLLYGEGGHIVKHQDTEKEDGMVATLVVQLPSLHEGGDLVVYGGGKVKYRHDFGKKEGSARYLPHYAVHYADAEHALEKVTKGYRLVLVYSLCLPPTMRHLIIGALISSMSDDDELFALLLAHEYTGRSIKEKGSGALKSVDRARFQMLQDANTVAAPGKALQFFIAQLKHDINYWDDVGCQLLRTFSSIIVSTFRPKGDFSHCATSFSACSAHKGTTTSPISLTKSPGTAGKMSACRIFASFIISSGQ
ncbi:hypothetical protein PC129_g19782 [Phytophthora cactorum]|uniref:Fe2OG dioxygenase domain-containing protein n=1 Tax=Phytophthora cactorum TaxID=29920 RepID=A0A329RBC7_9STRA|nr:hypothetical protein Pcac1_g26513 [Phytophthora cactorum]KAG2801654.1 hypothetical protein PC112_g19950 [Phytophthora cactorum]KAG2803634.1 hypothetical protein PC111_g18600 [Phytophthora cactorum]KAG2853582.1 hypothetical protein PC113_g14043 [Phytophthora cactorum]KAG2886572.1 hypothetical protein PC114_g19190 [Phytophthora cactorum]